MKQIVDSGELGKIREVSATFAFHSFLQYFVPAMKEDDIRFDFDLAGGTLLDLGCQDILLHCSQIF
jgi:predicted dehydrogenase